MGPQVYLGLIIITTNTVGPTQIKMNNLYQETINALIARNKTFTEQLQRLGAGLKSLVLHPQRGQMYAGASE